MRVRARFTKLGKIRFVSHRDLARIWERALRRADLPVAYSGGFSPRPRFHFGLALSVGHESWAEYLDVDLVDDIDEVILAALPDRFSAVLPTGVDCTAVAVVPSIGGISLQEAVTSSSWSIGLDGGSIDEAAAAVDALLGAPSVFITRERKGKTVNDDIRPYVRSLSLDRSQAGCARPDCADAGCDHVPDDPGVVLRAEIGTQPRTLRPAELIGALGPMWRERRVVRLAQWIDHEDGRQEPLALPAGPLPWLRTETCAT